MFYIALLLTLSSAVYAREGVDVSFYHGELTQQDVDCLLTNNRTFAIIELWRDKFGLNQYFNYNFQLLKAAGFSPLDAYALICNECAGNTPENICESLNATLPSDFDGYLWIDIEPCDGCWSISSKANLEFIEDTINYCATFGFKLGIYSTKYCWIDVVGGPITTETISSLPLWYAHYDNNTNFDDFENYGVANWTAPVMKQYEGLADLCGLQIDFDYLPSDSEELNQSILA